jgi:uncharacterized SAM-binding protein YcdF (DUF218 family)
VSTYADATGKLDVGDALAFAAVVDSAPLLKADAIVVLSGDGEGRLNFACGMLQQGGAQHLVLSGGVDKPPFALTAHDLARKAIDRGVAPDRLCLEAASKNTREQAVNVVAMAAEREWGRLLLVASPFHAWRAFLTFVQALTDAGLRERVHLINAPASQLKWWAVPDGRDMDRLGLLNQELEKIEAYRALGHVASWAEGLAYLAHWEGK